MPGLSPQQIQDAYNIPSTGGEGRTVAIVVAFGNSHANADLKIFREHYGLPPCTEESGCFKRLNQYGEEGNYPPDDDHWIVEASLDADMASVACPKCNIVLVQANDNALGNMDMAVDAAAAFPGVTTVSNSWLSDENSFSSGRDAHFNHPGIPILAASGDLGYDACQSTEHMCYPASSKNVIAVGGTNLKEAETARGWEETRWGGAGAGCSRYQVKPSWQTDLGCSTRMVADVAAVASPSTAVSVYDEDWISTAGTSAATPIVAGLLAQASEAVRKQGPEAFYRHSLFDVTGDIGCGDRYLCNGRDGYDAPTGWGTPNGIPSSPAGFTAITDPATSVTKAGATLAGYVNPEGLSTGYHFEYGLTTSYGTSVPATNVNIGSGVTWKAVSQSISGLEPDKAYHYRLVATNSSGTVYGKDRTLATTPWTVRSMAKPGETTSATYEGNASRVSCTAADACVAVGSYVNSSKVEKMLAESWSGTEWSIQSTPAPGEAKSSQLRDVSCTTTSCTAVGSYKNSAGTELPLVERLSGGSWGIQTAPLPAGAKSGKLQGVSCTATKACTAVGSYVNSAGTEVTLAERWTGGEWSVQTTPNPVEGTKGSSLSRLSCTSSSDCMAVGSFKSSKTPNLLVERWNGTEWSIQSLSVPAETKSSSLQGISCSSAGACTTVGYYTLAFGGPNPLVERWNGSAWSLQSIPGNPVWPSDTGLQATTTGLVDVSCAAALHCIATGDVTRQGGEWTNEALTWNGAEWSVQEGQRPAQNSTLTGVSCSAPVACMAVGFKWVTEEGFEHKIPWAESSDQPVRGGPHVEAQSPVLGPSGFAALKAKVYAGGLSTTYQFEYGTTTAYGQKAPASPKSAGSALEPLEVSESVSGLSPNTTYHYRVVATNSIGTVQSPDQEFTIGAIPANTTLPVITPSTPAQAVPVSTTTGKWSGGPTSYSYQWKRCNASGGECSTLKGSTESTYVPTGSDVGSTLVAEVTAKNSEGSGSVNTAPTAKVKATGTIAEYALPAASEPTDIVKGPDGNLWFTESNTEKIGKITTSGTITEYALPKGDYPTGIALGSDGKLWFANYNGNKIGKITTSGTVTEYTLPVTNYPWDITAGPDNNLWFVTEGGIGGSHPTIGKITTSGTITEYALPKSSFPTGITTGPDNNLWFTNRATNKVGKITTSGTITEYSLPAGSAPYGIATGPDGNLWFANHSSNKIGKITTSGTITEYALTAGSGPNGIVAGQDGNLWFTAESSSKIGRITPSGTVTTYSLPASSGPVGITAGPDGMVWFADQWTSKIGTIAP